MQDTVQKKWVGGICIKDGKVLLIHRINKEKLFNQEYFVFPGKLTEEDESLEDALVEEFGRLSVTVKIGELFFSRDGDDESEFYYLCDYILGEPAYHPNENEEGQQFYTPMWISLSELDELIVYPESVKQHLLENMPTEK